MKIISSVSLDKEIYDIYDRAARALGDCKTEDVLASALCAYAMQIIQDMHNNGELKRNTSKVQS